MKKLITLLIVGGTLFTGTAFTQDVAPVRDKPGDRQSDHFRIPRGARENPAIQECIQAYRTARAEFGAQLKALRERLAAASDEDKAAIKEKIREQLKAHREDQREFRKKVRRLLHALRKDRADANAGN